MSRIKILTDLEVGGQRGRVLSPDGIATTLSATDYKDPPKVLVGGVERCGCDTSWESDRNRKEQSKQTESL